MARTKSKKKELSEAEIEANSTAMIELRRHRDEQIRLIHGNPRELYVADRKFAVVREGARFEGIVEHGKYWSGYSRPLELGEVIVCEGWKPGMDTDQEGVNWTGARMPEGTLLWCQVWPINGLFTPWPLPGYLKALPDDF
ncbi:hypothetical protein HOT31_gp148 [Microbacterium phage Hendrix]|uniref:Uncharacterized protein n=1 Tax=Microbacterium phage Hendrix TaxID=2182341 RepID=A0A2U8UUH0_9CAUD|nr:hypothetical protein HOT31_gp148 [Microbacterium phage Hendrix]AWN07818.1 hypothetical protein PBI_HENDRIX_147 [Microbacterium phage Hendrix]